MIKADYVFAVDCHNLMIKKAIQTCALISRGECFTDMVSSQYLNFTDTSSDSRLSRSVVHFVKWYGNYLNDDRDLT